MKRILFVLGMFVTSLCSLHAQAPESFKYQAIVRDTTGMVVQNQTVGIRITILQGGSNGTVVYIETHQCLTNVYGLINLNVGDGNPEFGTFALINWGINTYFLKTEIDIKGGIAYVDLGTTQLFSVPYALYAKSFDNLKEIDPEVGNNTYNYLSKWNGSSLIKSSIYDNGFVGIGTNNPLLTFDVSKIINGGILSLFNNNSSFNGSVSLKSMGAKENKAYLSVIGSSDFDGYNGFDLKGQNIGLLGMSLDVSTPDSNCGVMGYSNGNAVFGVNSETGRKGYLGGSNFGAYGEYSQHHFGYLGGVSYGVWGQYSPTNFGYLGSENCGVYGSTNTSSYTGYGGYFVNTSSNNNSIGVYSSAAYTGLNNIGNTNGLFVTSTTISNEIRGIYNYVDHTGVTGSIYGQLNNIDIAAGNKNTARGIYVDIERDDVDATTYGLYISALNGTTVYGVYSRAYGGNTNYAGYFDGDLAYNGSLINPSDVKFKENIKPLSGSLKKIMGINSYSYNYKNDGEAEMMNFSSGIQFGFIAQELESVFPELVSQNVNLWEDKTGKEGQSVEKVVTYKGVNYIGMIPVLAEAIKEQQEIIEEQQRQIDELKIIINGLSKK